MLQMKKNSFQQIRIAEDEYNGHPFIDVRVFTKGDGGGYYPTRQGLAVPTRRFAAFAEMIRRFSEQPEVKNHGNRETGRCEPPECAPIDGAAHQGG